jgi:beta-lactamase superfamily II metal-dependent hydrolase
MSILRLSLLICAITAPVMLAASGDLTIYWVDVEGGGATLVVTPAGESLLIDTGNPAPDDRDAKRIYDIATKQAGLHKIDYLLTTHYHVDHVGGLPALAKLIPIGRFFDHGDSIETQTKNGGPLYDSYKAISAGKRQVLKPGDHIPLKGVEVVTVASNGEVLSKPLKGAGQPNPLCAGAEQKEEDKTENNRSVGVVLSYGRFKFLDMGDLTWSKEMALACPDNMIGTVTLFQATHHGFFRDWSGAPAFVFAIKPQVVVVNNGEKKGLEPSAFERISKIPGLEAIWQEHLAVRSDEAHNTNEQRIANTAVTGSNEGHWLKAVVSRDGKFTITNSRNGYHESYTAR